MDKPPYSSLKEAWRAIAPVVETMARLATERQIPTIALDMFMAGAKTALTVAFSSGDPEKCEAAVKLMVDEVMKHSRLVETRARDSLERMILGEKE